MKNASVQDQHGLSKERILGVLDEFFESGYSVDDYCQVSEGLSPDTLIGWVRQYRPKDLAGIEGKFLTVELIDDRPVQNTDSCLFAQVGDIKLYRPVPAAYLKSLQS
jgi:hypothetical protein